MTEPSQRNRYSRIIEHIFLSRYQEGANEVEFRREEFEQVAQELGIGLPKNLGDIVYSLRYRTPLPRSITEKAPPGHTWVTDQQVEHVTGWWRFLTWLLSPRQY